ncbi:hypothetical protein [Streptomyces sp. NPDC056291]|uniref:hypothetical protein n=1 Tax=Streptomyces sp. NPDC056291 TaxID=3345772 RepID=UPI0035DC36FB
MATGMTDPDDDDINNAYEAYVTERQHVFSATYPANRPRKWFRDRTFLLLLAIMLLMLCMLIFASSIGWETKGPNDPAGFTDGDILFFKILVAVVLLTLLGFTIPWFLTRRTYMKNQNAEFEERLKAEREYARQTLENLKKSTELATLMQLNQGQIKTYHDIVTDQADKSFKSSRIAMGIGMFLLVCAAIGGAYVPLEEVRWFIGALAAFSTLLSGYLSRTYLTLYKESIGQLNRYFDQPVLNSYFLTAERLTQGLAEEHRDEIRKQVITEVLRTSSRMSGKPEPEKEQKPRLDGVRPKKRPKKQATPVIGSQRA